MLLSAIVAGGISFWIATATLAPSQDRQARLEGAVEFALSNSETAGLSSDFMSALNASASLDNVKASLCRELTAQIVSLDGLQALIGGDVRPAAAEYQAALGQFSAAINETQDPSDLGNWTAGLDAVVTSHDRLRSSMLSELGIDS